VPITLETPYLDSVLGRAGGVPVEFPGETTIQILRDGVTYRFPLTRFINDSGARLTILRDGDSIYVASEQTIAVPVTLLVGDQHGPRVEGDGRLRRGDCNDDGTVDISYAVFCLKKQFLGRAEPLCVAATNTNGDGAVDISDASPLLAFLFLGAPPPVAPFPDCGSPPLDADRELGCEAKRSCAP